jgi:valyl-tRNA synthetase
MNLPKRYEFKESEKKWQNIWTKGKIYKFNPKSKKKIYSVDTPPPTVSGDMHMGHAFSYSHQDFIVRYHRMKGENVFFPFGTDDNGLPTERLVEKLKKVKHSRMNRSDFVKLSHKTVKEIKPKFIQDWKNIGMSCDFNTTYSTIDEHCIKTSQKSFIDLHKKKLAYRKDAPTMWCVKCRTAIAQAELEDKELSSTFNDVIFRIGNEGLTIATTRPELIPACVCIYVHPTDKRYKKYVGKKARVPLFNYEVPIFADKSADPEKGTGVLMICSYGDKFDVEAITKRKLDPRVIINEDGTLNDLAGDYKGLTLKEARKKILEDLEKEELLGAQKPITHIVNVHDKCGTEIEFLSSLQWFIKVLDYKKKLIAAGNRIKWYPSFMKTRYKHWIENLDWDWGISRQRFYGVSFPVWYCKNCGKEMVASEKQLPVDPEKDKPLKKCSCGSDKFVPEKDVMDTWATSSVSPQIILDWVKDKKDHYKDVSFEKMYTMSLRPQAHDIIRTWAFYTIVKGIYNNGKIPWKDIVISGHVLDPKGRKMSKSKGNVVNPNDVLEKYGADAMRFWSAGAPLGKDFSYKDEDVANGLKTVNKLWNSSKFAIMHLEDFENKKPRLNLLDKGVLSKFNELIKKCTVAFDSYEYSKAKLLMEEFFWKDLCADYLEVVKDRLYNPDKRGESERKSAQYTLNYLILNTLKLFAPIMPYITEEIYDMFFVKFEGEKSIHLSSWPKYDKKLNDSVAEKSYNKFIEIVKKVRETKAKHNKSLKCEIVLTISDKDHSLLDTVLDDLKAVCNAKEILRGKFKVDL